MKKLNLKRLLLALILFSVTSISTNAYDPIYSCAATVVNKITDVTQAVNKVEDEKYNPLAFAAELENVDKNIYQNKDGVVIIGKKYVPDNY